MSKQRKTREPGYGLSGKRIMNQLDAFYKGRKVKKSFREAHFNGADFREVLKNVYINKM